MTECTDGGGWSYRPDGRTRRFEECLRMLVNCAAGDGNLLLNVGPLPTGEIAADQQAVLAADGRLAGPVRREHLRHARRPVPQRRMGRRHLPGPDDLSARVEMERRHAGNSRR